MHLINHKPNENLMLSPQLLTAIAVASSIYYNYTGQSKCLNISQAAVSSLGQTAWNFQVIRFVVILFSRNIIGDQLRDICVCVGMH